VLDAEAQRRFPLRTELMRQAPSIEDGLRASAREMAQYARDHPGWTGVHVEFWTHASRRPELRRRVATQHQRLLDTVGGLVGAWAARARPGRGGSHDQLHHHLDHHQVPGHDRRGPGPLGPGRAPAGAGG
jgi:hypothetical protein